MTPVWPFWYRGERPKLAELPAYLPVPAEDIRHAFQVLGWLMEEPWVRQDDYEIMRQAQQRLAVLVVTRSAGRGDKEG